MASLGTAYIKIAPDLTGIQGKIGRSMNRAGAEAGQAFGDGLDKNSGKSIAVFKNIGKAGLTAVGAAAVAAGAMITKNIGAAVGRVDTLNTFPRVLQAMGISADLAEAATGKLAKRLTGLPTPLEEGAAGVQRFVASGLNVDKATEAFLGVNNALLATGGNAQDTQIVMDSLQRVISAGSAEATTIQAIMSRMPTVLSALSKESGKTQQELYELFQENPQALLDSIIRLNKKGGAGMASLDEQARAATDGIRTGWDNMNTAITRGIADIITTIGAANISNAISNIGAGFESALKRVSSFVEFVQRNSDIFAPIAVGIGAVVTGITAWYAITKVMAAAQAVFNAVLAANPIGLIIVAVAGLVAGLTYFFTKTETGRKLWGQFTKALEGTIGTLKNLWNTMAPVRDFIAKQFKQAWDSLKKAFDNARTALAPFMPQLMTLGRIIGGVVVVALAVVVGAIVGVITIIAVVINKVASLISWFSSLGVRTSSAMAQFRNSVSNGINSVIGFFRGLPGRILSAIGNMGSLLLNAGKALLRGFTDGIKSMASAPKDAVMDAVSGLRRLLPSSDAKEGPLSDLTASGKALGETLAIGIGKGTKDAVRAAQGASQAIMGGFSGMSAGVAVSPAVSSGSSVTRSAPSNVTVHANLHGVMTRSRSDEREIAKGLIESVNEELRAKQAPEIGVRRG